MNEGFLARLRDAQKREQVLEEFNASTLDDVGPIGGAEQGMKILSEMNSLADDHDLYVMSIMPNVEVP